MTAPAPERRNGVLAVDDGPELAGTLVPAACRGDRREQADTEDAPGTVTDRLGDHE